MKQKRISIVMCTYNGEAFIKEQLDSIIGQTHPIDELIIQDDCSTDSTHPILCEYAQKYPFITVLQNEKQLGINNNFFSALERATGDFIAISDQDDIWEPNKIEVQLQAIGNKLLCSGFSKPFSTDGTAVRFDNRIPNHNLLRSIYIGSLSGHTLLFPKRLLSLMPDVSVLLSFRYYDILISMVAAAYDSIVFVEHVLVNHRRYIQAASYTTPTDNHLTISNISRNALRTFRFYRELKPEMNRRQQAVKYFLSQVDSTEPILKDAIWMIELQTSTSLLDLFRLSAFCVRHRSEIFYVPVKKGVLSFLRAAYFPISCSEYYRYLSKNFHKEVE